jgi:ubiquinone/menaquinone biosynthesis C-methylase UbiE
MSDNIDKRVVDDFGREWSAFDQSGVSHSELENQFKKYFSIFPISILTSQSNGFDLGCGSGRWAQFVAPRVATLHCIDPSEDALAVAKRNLTDYDNCRFHHAGVHDIPLDDNEMDFGYSLGVLHHVPDTAAGIRQCTRKLKPGAPLLLYLYYAFDNRPFWYRYIWLLSNVLRKIISILPYRIKYIMCQLIAVIIYMPLSTLAMILEKWGINVENLPLSAYRNKSFYTMRTDALDRFGTRLEQRFTKVKIKEMMADSGLENIQFSEDPPFWCAIGYKI